MIDMMLSEVDSKYDTLPDGYLIYAIYDNSNRCCYVGMTRVARNRMKQHLAQMTNVKAILNSGDDLRVEFYDKCDIDALFAAAAPDQKIPDIPKDRDWAESAEWFLCEEYHPYLNVKKGWPGALWRAKNFVRSEGLAGCLSMGDVARYVLKEWNPPFNRDAITAAYARGADASALARLVGIDCSVA